MLYRFKSDAGADVLMLQESAEQLFALLERPTQPQGIFECTDLPQLMGLLERGVAQDEAVFERAVAAARGAGEAPPRRTGVSLRQRAWPLRELMRAAQQAGVPVVWGV